MKRLTGSLLAALVPFVAVAAVSTGSSVASAATAAVPPATTGAPNWQSLEQTALGVSAGAQGSGPLNIAGLPSPVAQSTVTTPSGPVSLSQQTVVTTDPAGTVVVNMALLGGRQLIVSEMNPANGYQGETLVLAPGTSTVTATYGLSGAHPVAASTTDLRKANHGGGAAVTASDGVFHPSRSGDTATLAAVGGCWAYPQNPGVISSIYGRLVQGTGVIDCTYADETLSMIVGLYRTGVSDWTAGGSAWGAYLGENVYAPCYQSSRAWAWQTAEEWAVNGVYQGVADSGVSYFGCT